MDAKKIMKKIQGRARTQKHRAMKQLLQEESDLSCAETSGSSIQKSETENMTESQDESDRDTRDCESEYNLSRNESERESGTHGDGITDCDIEEDSEEDSEDQNINEYQYPNNENEGNANDNERIEQENVIDEQDPEEQQIREWAVACKINHNHLDWLLRILSVRLLPNLPITAKTFLNTSSATYVIKDMAAEGNIPGEFVYFTIAKGLQNCIDPTVHTNDTISLQINVDGIPLFSSSNANFWPILGKVHYFPDIYKPFPIAVYHGHSKPKSVSDYLEEFIAEIDQLHRDGLIIDGKRFDVVIKCFICDTPARSFLKCTKGHGGYAACERCEITGVRYKNRMIYPLDNCTARSDASFRDKKCPDHHTAETPLLRIIPPIDMIFSFILDFMHLCCLGIMKKLIGYWMAGPLGTRLSQNLKRELNRRIEALKIQVPIEFQRKPRSLNYYLKFKASEFRFILLYCGPIIFKNILNDRLYKHFLLLHTACRLLCSPHLALRYRDKAGLYLNRFFSASKFLYGPESAIINMHNIIHLSDDVLTMGCDLSRVTAFPFENFLGKMKGFIRTPNKPLSQLCRRLHEERVLTKQKPRKPEEIKILKTDPQDDTAIVRLKYKDFTLTNKSPDNFVSVHGEIFEISKLILIEGNIKIRGYIWEKKKPMFLYPFSSGELNMWQLVHAASLPAKEFCLTDVTCKMVKLSVSFREARNVRVFAIPLLHC